MKFNILLICFLTINYCIAYSFTIFDAGKTAMNPGNKVDDFDEDLLVQEIIQENPPAEQGLRAEWKSRTGWNRKEDINSRFDG